MNIWALVNDMLGIVSFLGLALVAVIIVVIIITVLIGAWRTL